MKKKEKQIFLGILLVSLLLLCVLQIVRPHDYGTVCIRKDGTVFGTYSLSTDQIIAIGDTNLCEIKDGKLTMTASTCPDHLCMDQGAIDVSGGMIVCLPNKITIEGVRTSLKTNPDLPDAIAG